MEQIVLNVNLKHVLEPLSMAQRGEVLTAIFDGGYQGEDAFVKGVFCYIHSLTKEYELKCQRMREISAKGVLARKKKMEKNKTDGELFDEHMVDRRLKRKVTKEREIYNKNNLNLFSYIDGKHLCTGDKFQPPSVLEVRQFVEQFKFDVDPEVFVNFYESHGWMVGRTPIRNWQATLKLWHQRKMSEKNYDVQKHSLDETYWHELAERMEEQSDLGRVSLNDENCESIIETVIDDDALNLSKQPFGRFMKNMKNNDIVSENEDE